MGCVAEDGWLAEDTNRRKTKKEKKKRKRLAEGGLAGGRGRPCGDIQKESESL